VPAIFGLLLVAIQIFPTGMNVKNSRRRNRAEQLMGAWIGFVPTLAPAVPTAWKLLARAKSAAKGQSVSEGD